MPADTRCAPSQGKEAERVAERLHRVGDLPRVDVGQRPEDRLGLAGGSRRVADRSPQPAIGRRRRRLSGHERRLNGSNPSMVALDRDLQRAARARRSRRRPGREARGGARRRAAPECSRMRRISPADELGLSEIDRKPLSWVASCHTTMSTPLGRSYATMSPGSNPRARNACTSWCAAAASSAKVR